MICIKSLKLYYFTHIGIKIYFDSLSKDSNLAMLETKISIYFDAYNANK